MRVEINTRLLGFERRGQVFIERTSLVAMLRACALELDDTDRENLAEIARKIEVWRP